MPMTKTFTVQLETHIIKPFEANAKKIGIPRTVYIRNVIEEELKKKTVFRRLTRG